MRELGDDAEAGEQPDSGAREGKVLLKSGRVFRHQETESKVDQFCEFQLLNKTVSELSA